MCRFTKLNKQKTVTYSLNKCYISATKMPLEGGVSLSVWLDHVLNFPLSSNNKTYVESFWTVFQACIVETLENA